VSVWDEGSGFSQEDLLHFSTRFYQGKGHREQFGTGLGLYLSRQLVEAHGGKLWAENKHPIGCQVCFTIPFQEIQYD
jgi:two-component system NarL family sensor kinase